MLVLLTQGVAGLKAWIDDSGFPFSRQDIELTGLSPSQSWWIHQM